MVGFVHQPIAKQVLVGSPLLRLSSPQVLPADSNARDAGGAFVAGAPEQTLLERRRGPAEIAGVAAAPPWEGPRSTPPPTQPPPARSTPRVLTTRPRVCSKVVPRFARSGRCSATKGSGSGEGAQRTETGSKSTPLGRGAGRGGGSGAPRGALGQAATSREGKSQARRCAQVRRR